jgi:dipeptidyl-peptidase-3
MAVRLFAVFFILLTVLACQPQGDDSSPATAAEAAGTETKTDSSELQGAAKQAEFQYETERFADLRILRYRIPGFEQLDLRTKTLLYYLANLGLAGRDIMWDQNYRYNLKIRQLLEGIIRHYPGDRDAEPFQGLLLYTKQMWFANGIHHHYANDKFEPTFNFEDLQALANATIDQTGFPLSKSELEVRLQELKAPIFDPAFDAKKVNKADGVDKIAESAVNFYRNLSEQEVVDYYAKIIDTDDKTPISYGLNSQLVKEDGEIKEKVWKVDGMYGEAIEQMVYWLEKAITVAENDQQRKAFELLIKYYRSGDLKDFDDYSIAWVEDTKSTVDVINGFIEVYNDPLAYRGSFETVVQVRDPIATERIDALAENAQWFEDNAPIMDEHKKESVKGITARVINVVAESGDASPATPIGINLPNSNWIRAEHGSKSVSLANIVEAYDAVGGKSVEEFGFSQEEIDRVKQWGDLAGKLHTDLHEVIGHASGKLNPGVGTPKQTLKQYGSTLEEGRADLIALYYLMDEKLVALGVMPSLEIGKAEYDNYIRNGMMQQLNRIKMGNNIEEDHMRNRQMIAQWAFEKGRERNVIERVTKEEKTYYVVRDYLKLRELFGQLLREVQRIKSEGDYEAGQALVEAYGIKVDPTLHQEVLDRYATLDIPPYSGFINPKLVAVKEGGRIVDVKVEYPTDFAGQMLEYSKNWGLLPLEN